MQNPFVKFATYYILINILVNLVLYFVQPEHIFSTYLGWMWMIILLIFMVLAVKEKKKENNNYISLQSAFRESWMTFVTGLLGTMIFNYFLLHIIDPNLLELQKEAQIEALQKMAGIFNISEDRLEKQIEVIREQGGASAGKLFFSYVLSLVMGAVPAIIIAALLKKSPEQ
jgi:hypothetical protein